MTVELLSSAMAIALQFVFAGVACSALVFCCIQMGLAFRDERKQLQREFDGKEKFKHDYC